MRKVIRLIINLFVYIRVKASNPSVKLGKSCLINWSVSFCGDKCITVGDNSNLRHYSILSPGHGYIKIGKRCSIGAFNYLDGNGGLEIGNYVRFGPHCSVFSANHTFSNLDKPIGLQKLKYEKVVIEDDVWIGANSVILAGVNVGTGSVIAAGSVVNRDVEPYSIYAGSPAKLIKKRQ